MDVRRTAQDAVMGSLLAPVELVVIQQAMQEAGRYGVQSSPNFLVNGRRAPEPPPLVPPLEFLSRIIEEELMRQAKNAPSDGR